MWNNLNEDIIEEGETVQEAFLANFVPHIVYQKEMKHIYLINLKKRKVFRFKRKGGQQNVQKRTYEVNI